MIQVVILLQSLALAATGPIAGRVVSGPGLRTGQAIGAGKTVRAPTHGASVTLLTTGGCLVRLAAGAAVTLGPPTKKTRCSTVRVIRGRVRLGAPASRGAPTALTLALGKYTVTLTGEGVARRDGVNGVCMTRGAARVTNPPQPQPATAPTGSVSSAPTPKPPPSSAGPGKCLWLSASGITRSAYPTAAAARDLKSTANTYDFATPPATVTVNLNQELDTLSAALHSGDRGGSDVDGGGQSMCLDTGGEGSAADLGSSAVDVVKPPPPTQLRLLLTLQRRGP